MAKRERQSFSLTDIGTLLAAGIFLSYTITYAIAWPRQDLIAGIVFESAILIAILGWRLLRKNSVAVRAKKAVISELSNAVPFGKNLRQGWRWLCLTIGAAVCIVVLVDLCSLVSISAGNFVVGEAIYANLPTSYLVTSHPALSAEVLAGMYAESGQYEKAEHIYLLIYDVRRKVFGEKNEMMVALLSDFGDFYFRQGNYWRAADWYSRSVQMSKEIQGVSGYGRPLTGLANCYRETGRFALAEKTYLEAVQIRSKIFGAESQRVLDSLKEYLKLSQRNGQKDLEASISSRISEIEKIRPDHNEGASGSPIVFMISGFLISYVLFGNYGILTRLVTRRLQNKVNAASATPRDLQNLHLLCAYQGIKKVP